ncbi:hypothetical protein F5X68DRAFT_229207 [Plectosphaerella plurivora]|uniref:F-box domain-containing protein n=1 Tax=Plectosphaerella plurivora TaxID=936078 RepID=A0A9P8VIF4_9PEZI|nr:hypothetical protein F5X68DRAFT_229207 [Plectosphaerella plurivora]
MAPPPTPASLDASQREASSVEKRSEKHSEITTTVPIFPPNPYRRNQYASLLFLPMELQFLIYSNLKYGDLQKLRATTRYFRQLISLDFIRICLGSPATDAELRFVCRSCMRYDPVGRRLVWPLAHRGQPDPVTGRIVVQEDGSDDEETPPPNYPGPGLPFSAICSDCAVRARQLSPGEYVLMDGGERKVRVCRWCGWPCHGHEDWGRNMEDSWPRNGWELHPRCALAYQMVIIGYYVLVCIRSGIALVTYILLWRIFADEQLVVIPSVLGFLLMGIILGIIYVRGREIRTYHVVGTLEFSVLALGIPPLVVVIRTIEKEYDAGVIAAEILLISHLIIRLINVLGNFILFLEYDVTRHHAPDIPPLRKHFLNPLIAGLVFWTSPTALENMWIGKGKHKKGKSFRRGVKRFWEHAKKSIVDYGNAHGNAVA